MERNKFKEIIEKTWFCHRPIFGRPCGRCGPCKDALNEGLNWRVPIFGRILGWSRSIFLGILKKLVNILKIKVV